MSGRVLYIILINLKRRRRRRRRRRRNCFWIFIVLINYYQTGPFKFLFSTPVGFYGHLKADGLLGYFAYTILPGSPF